MKLVMKPPLSVSVGSYEKNEEMQMKCLCQLQTHRYIEVTTMAIIFQNSFYFLETMLKWEVCCIIIWGHYTFMSEIIHSFVQQMGLSICFMRYTTLDPVENTK